MLTVSELWRHPVKSLQGIRVDEISIDYRGVVGDRRWGLRDLATDNVLTGRRVPELLLATGGDGSVTLPSGRTTSDNAELSEWLQRDVELIGTADGLRSTYEVPLDPLDGETNWVSWQGPAASFVDSTKAAVSMISAPMMRGWDHRRFRMNVVFHSAGDTTLVGQRVRLGTAVLDVVREVDRCVMVTRPQPNLDRDLEVLRSILHDHSGMLGVGALVVEPGVVRIGDTVEPFN